MMGTARGNADPEELAQHLLGMDWRGDTGRARSRVKLMREYLRRAAWWADALDASPHWPFFDITARVDPAIRARPELVESLTSELTARMVPLVTVWTCERALHWAALAASVALDRFDLPDPFVPLIVMFERGGGFTEEHGFIQVDIAGIPQRTLTDHLSPDPIIIPEITAALDDVDGIP